jgi:hypothetical protein
MPVVKEVEVALSEFVTPLAGVIQGLERVYGAPDTPPPSDSVVSISADGGIIIVPSAALLLWLARWASTGEAERQHRLNQEAAARFNGA